MELLKQNNLERIMTKRETKALHTLYKSSRLPISYLQFRRELRSIGPTFVRRLASHLEYIAIYAEE